MARTPDGRFFASSTKGLRAFESDGSIDIEYGGGDGIVMTAGSEQLVPIGDGLLLATGEMGFSKLSPNGQQSFQSASIERQFSPTGMLLDEERGHVIFTGSMYGEGFDSAVLGRRLLDGTLDGLIELPFEGSVRGATVLADGHVLIYGTKNGSEEGEGNEPSLHFTIKLAN